MSTNPPGPHPSTLCARAPGPAISSSRPLVPPIDMSVVYCPDDLDHVNALSVGTARGFIYARDGHPNAAQLAEKLARLEGGEAGLICASGMGAIAAALLSMLGQGDHVLLSDGVYGRTSALVARQLPRWGIGHATFDPADTGAARAALTPDDRAPSSSRPSPIPCSGSRTSRDWRRSPGRPAFPSSSTTPSPR